MELLVTFEFENWYEGLDDKTAADVYWVVSLLEAKGVTLPFPYSSAIVGVSTPMRELRVQSKGRPLRIFYRFDPARDAVLLIAGDKTGDDRFYEKMIPKAEALWQEYVDEKFEK